MEEAALKDILNLVYLSSYFGLEEVANFWEGVVKMNKWHQHRISELVVKKLFGTVRGKRICILGFAFKANTNDTRESAAINICKDLLDEGANLYIHDPKVNPKQIAIDLDRKCIEASQNFKNKNKVYFEGGWSSIEDISVAAEEQMQLLYSQEWEEYFSLDWETITTKMRKPAWLFDARSIIPQKEINKININFWRIGDGTN